VRSILIRLHRWFGLAAAAFLFISGATGALISWDHELDAWINPRFYVVDDGGRPALDPLELARRVEAADPRVRVTFIPLGVEPGHTLMLSVVPRIDPATAQPFAPGYNQVAVDPASGEVRARREWGKVALTRENLLPFLYKLHYSMHLPDGFGVELGVLFMGVIAIAWVVDTLVALWISFPNPKHWRRSFAFRWRDGGPRLTFDLHRSGALWAWLLVLVLAVTSVSMNLREQVMRPVVSWFSELSPSPFASRTPLPPEKAIEPLLPPSRAIELARAEARRRGITRPAGALWQSPEFGLWGVGFFAPGRDHGDVGLGNPWVYLDAATGAVAGVDVPGRGSWGDVFLQSMFPLHSGRIAGVPGRVLVSALGALVAMLSVTGVMLWARRRRARVQAARRQIQLHADLRWPA
jgi:uncharacterized iron-regulated membrane protein